jgi:hypothetical protein
MPHVHSLIRYLKLKTCSLNTFRFSAYVFIVVAILRSAQKNRLYVNSLISAVNRRAVKVNKYTRGAHSEIFPKFVYKILALWVAWFLS